MTISSSLNAGVAGLNAHASRLAGISDNIANSATAGYRRIETDFASLAVMDTPSLYVAGGVRTSSTRLIDEAGPLTSSVNATDLAVSGRGMLPISKDIPPEGGSAATQLRLTATGAFRPDSDGVLRDAQGNVLLGWPANPDGTFPPFPRQSVAGLEAVKIATGWAPGAATSAISIQANLPATAANGGASAAPYTLTTELYDTLGNLQSMELVFNPTGTANQWDFEIYEGDAAAGTLRGKYTLDFDTAVGKGGTLSAVNENTAGGPWPAWDPNEGTVMLQVDGRDVTFGLGKQGEVGGLTQLSDSFSPAASRLNGAPAGTSAALEVRPDGTVVTISQSGFERTIYKVPLVDVSNPNGLTSETGSIFSVSSESGPFYLWDAGEGTTGAIEGFSRQESATDVAGELTDLIQTQRAYSSNAKIIQTVDEMLQETTNLKR